MSEAPSSSLYVFLSVVTLHRFLFGNGDTEFSSITLLPLFPVQLLWAPDTHLYVKSALSSHLKFDDRALNTFTRLRLLLKSSASSRWSIVSIVAPKYPLNTEFLSKIGFPATISQAVLLSSKVPG